VRHVADFTFRPKPPYSTELTIHKPAGWAWLTPGEAWDAPAHALHSALRLDGGSCVGVRVEGFESTRHPRIRVSAYARRLDAQERDELERKLRQALDLGVDLRPFEALARRDVVLRRIVPKLRGMHEGRPVELWPPLVLAVTLQMAPIKRAEHMMDALLSNYGESLRFDRHVVRLWPSAKTLARVPTSELRRRCGLGYRARVLKRIARQLERGFPTVEDLSRLTPEEASARLQELYGVGEYSAEMVTPHASMPVDVWSVQILARLFGKRLPRGKDVRSAIPAVKAEAARRWGPWRGLAFVYILNALSELTDLT
jgi:DNA-3-methyladenine glycosylase II